MLVLERRDETYRRHTLLVVAKCFTVVLNAEILERNGQGLPSQTTSVTREFPRMDSLPQHRSLKYPRLVRALLTVDFTSRS